MSLPVIQSDFRLTGEEITRLQSEVRELARERNAVVLAHNYQRPEVQDVADFVGDSLGLSRQAAESKAELIAFCGVHFMAETASILSPDKTVLLPDLAAGCTLADSITADQLRHWKATHPNAIVVMYVNTTAEVKAESEYCCTSSNAVAVVEHVWHEHGEETEILFGPDMFLGAWIERQTGRKLHNWLGACHVHAGIRDSDIEAARSRHPDADLLVHPECGSSAALTEQGRVQVRSTGGMLTHAEHATPAGTTIVATETGMLYPLQKAAPDTDFVPANEAAVCQYMKTITLPKLRDSLRDRRPEVRVPAELADRARRPIERMLAIS